MRWLICVLLLGPLSACLQLGKVLDSQSDAGTSGAAGTPTDSDASTATGTSCGVDPGSGVTLCLGSSSCPDVLVDPDQLPGCGYRISGSTIDLECLCDDALCPVGSAASCSEAKALLADQTALGVCSAVAEGRCTTVEQESGANSGARSSCDKDCRSDCGGDLDCITLCGC